MKYPIFKIKVNFCRKNHHRKVGNGSFDSSFDSFLLLTTTRVMISLQLVFTHFRSLEKMDVAVVAMCIAGILLRL